MTQPDTAAGARKDLVAGHVLAQQGHGLLHLAGAVAIDLADILEHDAGHLFPLRP